MVKYGGTNELCTCSSVCFDSTYCDILDTLQTMISTNWSCWEALPMDIVFMLSCCSSSSTTFSWIYSCETSSCITSSNLLSFWDFFCFFRNFASISHHDVACLCSSSCMCISSLCHVSSRNFWLSHPDHVDKMVIPPGGRSRILQILQPLASHFPLCKVWLKEITLAKSISCFLSLLLWTRQHNYDWILWA